MVRRVEELEAIRALDHLRPADREVLMLSAWEDLTGPEIARALGLSVSAAEQRLRRAKHRFARALQLTSASAKPELKLNNEGSN